MGKYDNLSIAQMMPGNYVEGFFLLDSANVKRTANGSSFLAGKIRDKDADIEYKIWDYADTIHEHVGAIVKIRGAVQEYNGAKQLVIERIRLASNTDSYDLKAIVPCAPIDVDAVLRDLECGFLDSITNEVYRKIAVTAFERTKETLRVIPAAKSMHHAFVAGLLMHTYNIMKMCTAAIDVYGKDLIDRDLLLTGAFCHDLAKRKEYLLSEIGLVTEYSIQGQLLGHLVMGAQEIAEIAQECGIPASTEEVILLQHMLLSHHGEPEYGAAVVPKCIEAEILSRIDMLDAKVEMYREAMETIDIGTMSDYNKGLGHTVYNHA